MSEKVQFANDFLTASSTTSVNQNILYVNLRSILNSEPAIKFKFTPEMNIMCIKCGGIISYMSRKNDVINEWICEICGQINETNILDWDNLIKEEDIEFNDEDDDYETEESYVFVNGEDKSEEQIIVFCIDTSGSMAGPRINSVKTACLKTLELLCNQGDHELKFALITFDSTSKYYGNGNLNESTITKQDWYDNSEETMERIRKNSFELLSVKNSYETIRQRLETLDADGGTNICDALAHSVLLTSMVKNSFLILCTDGCACDSDESFYNSIISYCNEQFIKISIVSFEQADCNLSMLGRCACETGGRIYRTLLNGHDLDAHFIEIIEDNLRNYSPNKDNISLNIIADYDEIILDNKLNTFTINNLNTNMEELLIEYNYNQNLNIQRPSKDFIVFQTQIKTKNTIRILTKRIKLNEMHGTRLNEHLIHVYHLKKISNLILGNKNMQLAKEHLKKYEEFIQYSSHGFRSAIADMVVKLVNRLPLKQNFRFLNDNDAQILYNNKNLTVEEFVSSIDLVRNQEIQPSFDPVPVIMEQMNRPNEISEPLALECPLKSSNSQLQLFPVDQLQQSPNLNINISDNVQFTNHLRGDARTQKTLNRQSLKMIMIALKMIKEATSICMKARNILNLNHMKSSKSQNKNKEFLKSIFDNINRTEDMVNALSKSSSVLARKDFNFLNKMFEELNVYLELDLLESMQAMQANLPVF